jgi:hypothetical protein
MATVRRGANLRKRVGASAPKTATPPEPFGGVNKFAGSCNTNTSASSGRITGSESA